MDTARQLPALRRLARALTHDVAEADDLVQDTLETALIHPPTEDRATWPWLSTVLRNRRISRRRADERRAAREREVAPTDRGPSPEQIVLGEALLVELAALSADDRELLALRFWQGLSTVECAAQLQRPASTVRTQLQRALVRLRERLDRRGGGRAAWTSAFVPLLVEPRAMTRTALGSTSLTLGGVCAGTVLWLGVAIPHGCESALGGEVESPPAAGASTTREALPTTMRTRRAAPRQFDDAEAPTPEAAPEPSDAEAIEWSAAPESRTAKGVHPQMAVSMALVGVWESLATCYTRDAAGSLRFDLRVRFDPDGTTHFERMDVERVQDVPEASLECVRQSVLARELDVKPVDPVMLGFGADVSLEYHLRGDLRFADGTATLDGVEQQPRSTLYFVDGDKAAATTAIAGCGDGAITLELAFAAKTGHLEHVREVAPTQSPRGRCVGDVLSRTVAPSWRFEPEVAEDALLRCEFGAGPNETESTTRHTCVNVGPRPRWMPRPI